MKGGEICSKRAVAAAIDSTAGARGERVPRAPAGKGRTMTEENEPEEAAEVASEERVNKNVYLISLVREPVFPKDAYTVNEVARLLCISRNRVMGYATRPRNPLPLRRWENGARGSFVLRDELIEWLRQNTMPAQSYYPE